MTPIRMNTVVRTNHQGRLELAVYVSQSNYANSLSEYHVRISSIADAVTEFRDAVDRAQQRGKGTQFTFDGIGMASDCMKAMLETAERDGTVIITSPAKPRLSAK